MLFGVSLIVFWWALLITFCINVSISVYLFIQLKKENRRKRNDNTRESD